MKKNNHAFPKMTLWKACIFYINTLIKTENTVSVSLQKPILHSQLPISRAINSHWSHILCYLITARSHWYLLSLYTYIQTQTHYMITIIPDGFTVSSTYRELNSFISSSIHRIRLEIFTAEYSCSPGMNNWAFP